MPEYSNNARHSMHFIYSKMIEFNQITIIKKGTFLSPQTQLIKQY